MNPVFIILVLLAAVLIWFLLSFVFFPVGKLAYRLYKDAIDEINREDDGNKNEENKKK